MHDVSSAASAVPCALIFKWLLLAGRWRGWGAWARL